MLRALRSSARLVSDQRQTSGRTHRRSSADRPVLRASRPGGLGERTVLIVDVLQADGGTRTASLPEHSRAGAGIGATGAFKLLKKSPLRDSVAATSVGLLRRTSAGSGLEEISRADVDMNG